MMLAHVLGAVHIADGHGFTLLHHACQMSSSGASAKASLLVDFLCWLGADPSTQGKFHKRNCLHLLCMQATRPDLRSESAAALNCIVIPLITPDLLVSQQRYRNIVSSLNQRDDDGNTPLHTACAAGHTRAVEVLLQSEQCDVNSHNNASLTPLMVVHRGVGASIIELLVKRGAHVNAADRHGNTAAMRLVDEFRADDAGMLASIKAMVTVSSALQHDDDDVSCFDANAQNQWGKTVLHLACVFQCVELVSYLLREAAFAPGATTADGASSATTTVPATSPMLLLDMMTDDVDNANAIDANAEDEHGMTPLTRLLLSVTSATEADASTHDVTAIVRMLLQAGASHRHQAGMCGRNALLLACAAPNCHAIVDLLLQHDEDDEDDEDTGDGDGDGDAKSSSSLPYIESSNRDDNVVDGEHRPLHIAARCTHAETVRVLLRRGAALGVLDKQQRSAKVLTSSAAIVSLLQAATTAAAANKVKVATKLKALSHKP
jgi:ankyrin repeat protein